MEQEGREKLVPKSHSVAIYLSLSLEVPAKKASPALNWDIIVPSFQHLGIFSKNILGGKKYESSQEFKTTLKSELEGPFKRNRLIVREIVETSSSPETFKT